MPTHPALRVLARIDINEPGCWIWPGSRVKNGYGTVSASPPYVEKSRPLLVHRVTYEWFIADIPEGMDLDHLCRVRICCNPTHLEPVTRLINARRGDKYAPEKCVHGHRYDDVNTYIDTKGYRRCRACNRDRMKARK